jgi:hypothetical protein
MKIIYQGIKLLLLINVALSFLLMCPLLLCAKDSVATAENPDVEYLGRLLLKNNYKGSSFGFKDTDKALGVVGWHKGIDYMANMYTPVYSPVQGVVSSFDEDGKIYGRLSIKIDGGQKYFIFLHLSRLSSNIKTPGHIINVGDLIGYSGKTSLKIIRPHLHVEYKIGSDKSAEYELVLDKNNENPSLVVWLPVTPDYCGINKAEKFKKYAFASFDGVGNIKIGMKIKEISNALNVPIIREEQKVCGYHKACYWVMPMFDLAYNKDGTYSCWNGYGVSIMIKDGMCVAIDPGDKVVKNDYLVLDSRAKILLSFPRELNEIINPLYKDQKMLVIKDGKGNALVFNFVKDSNGWNTIFGKRVGHYPEVTWADGWEIMGD